MTERCDTVVVGGGQSGLAVAYELRRAGRSFVVLDAAPRVGDAWRGTGRVPCRVDASLYRLLAHVRTDRGPGRLVAGALAGRGSPLVRAGPAELAAAGVGRLPKVTGVTGGRPRLADGRVLDVTTVVWCTGFRHDFGWLPPAAHDGTGAPVHDRGRARHVPGLAFAGLRFQATLASGIVAGAGADARLAVAATAPVS